MVAKEDMYVFSSISFEIYLSWYVHEVMEKALQEILGLHFQKIKLIEYDMGKVVTDMITDFNTYKSKINFSELKRNMEEKGFYVLLDTSGNIDVGNVETIGFQIQCTTPHIKYKKRDWRKYALILVRLFHKGYVDYCTAGNFKMSSNVIWETTKQEKATNQDLEIEIKGDKNKLIYRFKDKNGRYVNL